MNPVGSGKCVSVVRACLSVALVLLVAGCGTPHDPAQQADEVSSIAAEASLLSHGAAEGSTTDTFTREHAKALRKLLGKFRPAIENRDLARLAGRTDAALGRLADEPGDESGAAHLEDDLSSLADRAEELAS